MSMAERRGNEGGIARTQVPQQKPGRQIEGPVRPLQCFLQ